MSTLRNGLTALRPDQWIKNAFLLAPLLFSDARANLEAWWQAGLAVFAFCLVSSAGYVFNDWRDRKADRLHSIKCKRPFATGHLCYQQAIFLIVLTLALAIPPSLLLPKTFLIWLILYIILSLFYSLKLKHIALIDLIVISLGFVIRVLSGAVAAEIVVSFWLLLVTFLLAFFLALAKRRDDIIQDLGEDHRTALSGYTIVFLDHAQTLTLAASTVIYATYALSERTALTLGTPNMPLTIPFVFLGMLRYLQLVLVYGRSGSPTRLVLTDYGLISAFMLWLLTVIILLTDHIIVPAVNQLGVIPL